MVLLSLRHALTFANFGNLRALPDAASGNCTSRRTNGTVAFVDIRALGFRR
jgi:hypothetical protein